MTAVAGLSPQWALGFAAVYAVLASLARLTVVDDNIVGLVWLGAGIAMLWLLAESPQRQAHVLVPLTLIHAGINGLTGAPWQVVVFGALSLTCQTWITVALLRRWCPLLLGAGGTASFRSPRTLGWACVAAALGSLVGAAIGSWGLWLAGGEHWNSWEPLSWFARHFVGLVVIGCVGHLAWEWNTQPVARRAGGGSQREFALMWAVSMIVVAVVFLQPLPIVFLVVPLCVWSAARFATYLAGLHALALGVGGLLLTLAGRGPSTSLADPVQAVFVAQLFLVSVVLTGLAVGTLSDRIDELVGRMSEAQARSAEQAELLAEMTESMGEGLIVLDREGRIERSNGASWRLAHRVSPDASDAVALAHLVERVLAPPAAEASASHAELGVGDVLVPTASGGDLVIAVSRTPLVSRHGEDGRSGVLLVLSEVTEHRHGLRPLVSFASTAAHDLRGPLTAIRSWLDLAALDLADDSDTLASINRAQLASKQMAGLISDLLAQAVAEAGDLVAEDVALTGNHGALVQAAALLRPEDVLEVPADGLPRVHADRIAVRQLFANLVGNAVKYSRRGVPAHVRVSAERQGSRVVIEVEDNGIGVDQAERALIFERFHRGDTARPGKRGTGMGLSICQAIVQRHGGSIECLRAESGQGSVFRFDLPAAAAGVEPVSEPVSGELTTA